MLPASALNQYVNMEYNNENHNLHINGNISTSNNSSLLTLTSTSVTSKNNKGCLLFIPIHDKIKYSDLSEKQSRSVRCAIYLMKLQIKVLANKIWNYIILEYILKYKYMKEVVSSMDIIITSSTQEIIRHNKCQMRFLDKLVLKHHFDKKLMINEITCSILDSPSTSDYDDMENGVSKSTVL